MTDWLTLLLPKTASYIASSMNLPNVRGSTPAYTFIVKQAKVDSFSSHEKRWSRKTYVGRTRHTFQRVRFTVALVTPQMLFEKFKILISIVWGETAGRFAKRTFKQASGS